MESEASCSSLSDSSFSDVDFDNLSDSVTRDSKSSDDDSILNSTSDNVRFVHIFRYFELNKFLLMKLVLFQDLNEATGLDDDYLSSLSDNESDVENNIEESIHDPTTMSIANFENVSFELSIIIVYLHVVKYCFVIVIP